MALVNLTDLKNVVECAICLDTFDNPKTLQCHHSYCKRCLDGLLEFQPNGSATIKCPKMCVKNTCISKNQTTNDLGVEYSLKDLLSLISKTEESSLDGQCDFCSGQAVKYCMFCTVFLCKTCTDPHDDNKDAFKHVTYNAKVDQFRLACVKHNTDVDFVCCGDTDVCVYCRQRQPHRNHNPKTLNEYENAMKEDLRKSMEAKKNISQRLKEIKIQITEAKSELEGILNRKILNSLAEYTSFLNEEAECIREKFHNVTKEHFENIKSLDQNEYLKCCLSKTGFQFLLQRDQIKKLINTQNSVYEISVCLSEGTFKDEHPLGVLQCNAGRFSSPLSTETFKIDFSLANISSLSVDHVKEIISYYSQQSQMENLQLDESLSLCHVKELREQCLGSGTINFKIDQVSEISSTTENEIGSSLYVRGIWWGLCFGSCTAGGIDGVKYASVYLKRKKLGKLPKMNAYFKITLKNNKGADWVKGGFMNFKAGGDIVQINKFILWSDLLNVKDGYLRNDSITINVFIEVDVPIEEVPWYSKGLTGFAGVQRQKHSCCLNSILQSIFSLTKLRRLLLSAMEPTRQSECSEKELAILQCFRDLDNNVDSVSANKLHRLLCCDENQYSTSNLYQILFESMEIIIFKCNSSAETFSELFGGKKASLVICDNTEHSYHEEELFRVIELTMTDCISLDESLNDYYVQYDGLTSFMCDEECIKTNKKDIVFQYVPPVLQFHMKESKNIYKEYSTLTLNEYFIPSQLDIRYLPEDADSYKIANYSLHSVLCQDWIDQHYFVYINPKGNGNWFKFEDTVVCQVTEEQATQRNFLRIVHRLTYIRTCDIQNVLL